MDPQKITELANLLRNNGDKILNSEFTLTLSGSLVRALNDSFKLLAVTTPELGAAAQTFQVVKPINSKSPVFRDLQLIHDFVQKTALLCIVQYPGDDYFDGTIDLSKFRMLKRLELQKTNVRQIVGIQPLRAQLQQLICVKSLCSVEDVITHCGGDNSNGFVWNELKIADFSYNSLQTVDSSLEFAQFLQVLNLRHNQLISVEALKFLPHLKTLDLSFNRLPCIPQFHMEACKRLQSLNMSNNDVEDLIEISKLDALTDLDLSDNYLLDHSSLLPLSALLTLKHLKLYGNPLHCHPKHRLATSQYLHKNSATVKFILDFEPLSKSEKAVTGSQKLRQVSAMSRLFNSSRSSAASISSRRSNSDSPASSVGSLRSFKFNELSMDMETSTESNSKTKKRSSKIRTVEIEDCVVVADATDEAANGSDVANISVVAGSGLTQSLIVEENTAHLEANKHIETLREKYGAQWLQSGNAEMMQSVLGIESDNISQNLDIERHRSRQLFNELLEEFSTTETTELAQNETLSNTLQTSTPTNESLINNARQLDEIVSPIKTSNDNMESKINNDTTLYMSMDENSTDATCPTFYKSINDSSEVVTTVQQAPPLHIDDIYATSTSDEPEISDTEDDEETYIVYPENLNNAIFLTLSSNFLREKDTLTHCTKTKWSLKILESCERLKSNMLRINFDTVKLDKQERLYTVEDGLCQELEKKLRDILSQRNLTEMNQTIYRCVSCSSEFSHEYNKYKRRDQDIRCPQCKSTFIVEIHDTPTPFDKTISSAAEKLSPAAIVEESPVTIPLLVKRSESVARETTEETTSIGSANSLNGSSSCSKISNSQSSFDSNQSVVGSSNTDRDNDFRTTTCDSDVEIISNPSQSSIEVLDQMQHSSRKTSEERRVSHVPHLETIDDQSFIERECSVLLREHQTIESDTSSQLSKSLTPTKVKTKHQTTTGALANVNLTESSSSGSVTDSICTAYEQQADKMLIPPSITTNKEKNAVQNFLAMESAQTNNNNNNNTKLNVNEKNDAGISSMLGALFQSTNMLMSSSKKIIAAEATTGTAITTSTKSNSTKITTNCRPYKFNYIDFNDVDHRLKLYFYQTKFKEVGEHFKWIVRGRLYNENTHKLCVGIVVMSTCKCYILEAFADEHDDVTKWLQQVVSVTHDRLETIQLLPWKMGLSFQLRGWGGFLLLLQDILRTDSLLLCFQNNSLPEQCELKYKIADEIGERLSAISVDEQLKMCTLLTGCEVTCDSAKRNFKLCGLLTTDSHLYITSSKVGWLSLDPNDDHDIEICLTQVMTNLVDVERHEDNTFVINFLDETQNKSEVWNCIFETKDNAESCLKAIAESWQELFGVPL